MATIILFTKMTHCFVFFFNTVYSDLKFPMTGFEPRISDVRSDQCDHMAGSFVQCFAIYNNENLPNSIKISQSRFKILPKT